MVHVKWNRPTFISILILFHLVEPHLPFSGSLARTLLSLDSEYLNPESEADQVFDPELSMERSDSAVANEMPPLDFTLDKELIVDENEFSDEPDGSAGDTTEVFDKRANDQMESVEGEEEFDRRHTDDQMDREGDEDQEIDPKVMDEDISSIVKRVAKKKQTVAKKPKKIVRPSGPLPTASGKPILVRTESSRQKKSSRRPEIGTRRPMWPTRRPMWPTRRPETGKPEKRLPMWIQLIINIRAGI